MTRGRVVRRAAVVVVLLAGASVLIPGSPVYLPNFFSFPGQYEGHSSGYWIGTLNSPDPEVRSRAIFALGAMGADGGDAVPALAKVLLEDPDREVRHQAAQALMKMGPASREAVPALAEALSDEEPAVRMNAAIALFRLRAEARPAIPALIKALNDPDNQTNLGTFTFTIQDLAARALGRATGGSAEAVPALTAALDTGGSEGMRLAALSGLDEIGPEARSAVPRLRILLTDKSAEVRRAAAEALRAIEGEAAANQDLAGARDKP
jgi:HEAT repeat protein